MSGLETFIGKTIECDTEAELYHALQAYLTEFEIDFFIYFIMAQNLRAVSPETGLIHHNFPLEFARNYFDNDYVSIDPVIQQSLKEPRPFHWFDVADKKPLNSQQKQMFNAYRAANFIDGLAIPVFGPMGTIALFSLASRGRKLPLTHQQLSALQFACLQVHNRYFELAHIFSDAQTKPLSLREKQALSLVADGLATPGIAEKLGVSVNTVDTMLRRIFVKLDVNTRISAVLKAIGSGLILP